MLRENSQDHRAVVLRRATDPAQWDELVFALPAATPFHTWTFLESSARHWGHAFEPLLALVDDEPVGVVPLVAQKRYGVLRWVNNTKEYAYAGPAVRAEHLSSVLAAMARRHGLTTMRERQEVRVDPEFAPDVAGWTHRPGTTMTVHLTGRTVEDLEKGSSRQFRGSPKRAAEHGLVIESATDEDLTTAVPALMQATYGRQGLPSPYDDGAYLRVAREFAARDQLHAVIARVGDRAAGMGIVLVTGDRSYLWVTAQDPEFSTAQPSMAVERAHVLWSHERGLAAYDLIGGSTEGIARFKRSVGAVDEGYTIYERGRRA